jgi:hypothetical protein
MPSKCDPMDLGRVEHEVDEEWQDEHCVYLSLGFPALTESSIMTAQGIVACQFGPSIHRSAQSIAVIVNGLDATLVGRGAKVSVDQTVSNRANIYLLR